MTVRRCNQLSWSQVNLYKNRCKYAWQLRYLEKRRPPKPQPMKFGIAFHNGAEHLLDDLYVTPKTTPETAIKNAQSYFGFNYSFDLKGPNTAKWLPIGEHMIGKLAENLLEMGDDFQLVSTEQWVESFVRSRGELKFKMVGKVDCIARVQGELTIIDWKTASGMKYWSSGEEHEDMQLTGYQTLLLKEYPNPQLAYVITTKPQGMVHWLPTTRTLDQVKAFRRMVFLTHREMEAATKFPKTTDPFICNWCDMKGHYCDGIAE